MTWLLDILLALTPMLHERTAILRSSACVATNDRCPSLCIDCHMQTQNASRYGMLQK